MKQTFQLIAAAFGILLIFSTGCSRPKPVASKTPEDLNPSFEGLKQEFLGQLWRLNPDWASSQGFHNYDSLLVIPNAVYRAEKKRQYEKMLHSLQKYQPANLTVNNRTDRLMMGNFLHYQIWQDSVFRSFEWNPAEYNLSGPVAEILNSRHAPLNNRLRDISLKLTRSPEFYKSAIANLKRPTIEHTRLAIIQNKGGLSVFGKSLLDSVAKSGLAPAEKKVLNQRIAATQKAMEEYVSYLENKLLPSLNSQNSRNFRIGKANYEKKFNFEIQSRYKAFDVYLKALDHKSVLHREMIKLSSQLWPKYFSGAPPRDSLQMVGKMIAKLSEKHVPREQFVAAVRRQIPELETFVQNRNLLTLDPNKPLVVRETPLYLRGGGAGASISAPGPYDAKANTYYNVTPLDQYTPEQAESYLREYNNYTLQILNIHEAIPGHYAQLVYSNQSPSVIKAILGNDAMVEGWAVYAERMMLENGYQDSPEMWLMYYKWNLRTTLNAIIDYGVHVQNYSENRVMELLRKEGFQEQAEAEGKWTRVRLSQVQLSSYFTGYTEIMELREELKKQQGPGFSLKKFHEEFLSYGSAPVKYIRDIMLAEQADKAKP